MNVTKADIENMNKRDILKNLLERIEKLERWKDAKKD